MPERVKTRYKETRKRHHHEASEVSDDVDDNDTPSHKSPRLNSQSYVQSLAASAHRDDVQKQPSRIFLRKRYSENMQQIYRRIPRPKCDFNKVFKQLY